jgi:hypothetical protein
VAYLRTTPRACGLLEQLIRGTGSTKTDHARKSESIESLRAALNVFADPRFRGYGHYTHSEELADAESHSICLSGTGYEIRIPQ